MFLQMRKLIYYARARFFEATSYGIGVGIQYQIADAKILDTRPPPKDAYETNT